MKTNRTKYIATAVCIIVFITVVGVAHKNKYIFSNQQINNNSGDEYSINSTGIANNTNNNSQKKKIELNGEIKLDDSQIYHMNTLKCL